jgi:hypothetical protein
MGIDIFIPDCLLGLGNFYFKEFNMTKQNIIRMGRRMPNLFYTPLGSYLIGLLMGYLIWGKA